MKTIKSINFKVLSVLALAVLSLSSCLKDPRYLNFAGSPPLVEFPLPATNANKVNVVKISLAAVANTGGLYTLQTAIDISSPNTNPALTPTIAVDNSAGLIAAGPATVTTGGYFPLPPADYTISTLTPTIPAGHGNDALINIVINPSLIATAAQVTAKTAPINYAIRLVIANGGGIQISNWNTVVYNIQVTL